VSADPVAVLPRKQAFASPGSGLYSRAGGAEPPPPGPDSAVRIVRADQPSGSDIEGLVFAPGVDLVALDDSNNVWIREAKGWRPFHKELPVARIGWDRESGLLLYQFDERILYCFPRRAIETHDRKIPFRTVGDKRCRRFCDGSVVEGTPALLFARDGKIREIVRVSASEIFDAARDSRGTFWFSTADGLWVYEDGKTRRTADGLWKPNNIVAMKNMVFVWSEDGRILYRVNTDKELVEALDLRGIGFGDVYVRRNFVRSFAIKNEDTFCFAFGPDVVEVSLRGPSGVKLTWAWLPEGRRRSRQFAIC